jgi:tellurite resistance-related uncharacterized protein
MSRRLPRGLVAYRRTPIFTEATLPAGLRTRHRTKANVWGRLIVIEGRLQFRRLDPFPETMLDPAHPAVIAPEEPHEIEPIGPVHFFIEFYRAPPTSAAQ